MFYMASSGKCCLQVKKANGTIVDRNWIPECHSQRKLVDIDEHLLCPGKPWRKQAFESFQKEAEPETEREENGMEDKGAVKRKNGFSAKGGGRASRKSARGGEDSGGPTAEKTRRKDEGKAITDADVAGWVDADVTAAEKFLEGEGAEPGLGETMRDLGVQGVLGCFDFMLEELEEGRSLEEAKEGWVTSLPRGVEEVIAHAERGAKSQVRLLQEMKERYERALGVGERDTHNGSESGRDAVRVEEGESDAPTEELSDREEVVEDDSNVVLLTEQEVASAKERLLRQYAKNRSK
jgi:DNA-repair protein XRCC1